MGFKRYPDTALITWMSGAGTIISATGAYSEGTLTTLSIICNAQPASERYAIDNDGNKKRIRYDISMPLVTASVDVSTAQVTYESEKFTLLNLMNYQLHSEGILI